MATDDSTTSEPEAWAEARDFWINGGLIVGGVYVLSMLVFVFSTLSGVPLGPDSPSTGYLKWLDIFVRGGSALIVSSLGFLLLLNFREFRSEIRTSERIAVFIMGVCILLAVLNLLIPFPSELSTSLIAMKAVGLIYASLLLIRARQFDRLVAEAGEPREE